MNVTHLLSFASFVKSVGGVLLAVVILLVMVTIHEFGHYIAGKALGFKINEFAVGFGPAIFKKRSKKTGELFALRVIPLGGYCAFDGEDEYEEEQKTDETETPFLEMQEQPKEEPEYPEPTGARFNEQPPWKRIIVLIAGATMNYLLALLLIVCMFGFIGRPVYRVREEYPEPPTDFVVTDSGLNTDDVILKINGESMYVITDYIDALNGKKAGDTVAVTMLRDNKVQTVTITLQKNASFVNTSDTMTLLETLGIYGLYSVQQKDGFFETLGHSFMYSFKLGGMILRTLGELLTGKLGLNAMGGPVTTIKVTSEAASNGVWSFLNIASLIGVNLAVFNLLPIPALDGCKVVFCIIEWIRKKPVNRKVETIIHFAGLIFIFAFAILVDILQFL